MLEMRKLALILILVLFCLGTNNFTISINVKFYSKNFWALLYTILIDRQIVYSTRA